MSDAKILETAPTVAIEGDHAHVHNVLEVLVEDGDVEKAGGAVKALADFLAIRGIHSATGNDHLILPTGGDDGFVDYWRKVTGELGVVVTATLREAREDGVELINPYIASPGALDQAERYGMKLFHPSDHEVVSDGIIIEANDKGYFREVAGQIGMPIVPDTRIIDVDHVDLGAEKIHDQDEVLDTIHELIGREGDNWKKVFIQANRSGGGLGNIDLEYTDQGYVSTKFNDGKPMTREEMEAELNNWVAGRSLEGSNQVIVAPFIEPEASHTVSMYIPEDGSEPYMFGGIFAQRLDKASNDYLGFTWPANDQYTAEYGQEMEGAALRWARHLQERGVTGPTDVDYAVGKHPRTGERILYASESNTRWDGFNFGLRYGARAKGWDFRTLEGIGPDMGIAAHDHVALVGGIDNTADVITFLQDNGIPIWGLKDPETGLTNYDRGVVLTIPPKATKNGYHQLGIVCLDQDPNAAEEMVQLVTQIAGAPKAA